MSFIFRMLVSLLLLVDSVFSAAAIFPREEVIDLDYRFICMLSALAEKPYSTPVDHVGGDIPISCPQYPEPKIWAMDVVRRTYKEGSNERTRIESLILTSGEFGTVVVFRGTEPSSDPDWAGNFDAPLIRYDMGGEDHPDFPFPGMVHKGFAKLLASMDFTPRGEESVSLFHSVKGKIDQSLREDPLLGGKPIYFIGHSRGGALATLSGVLYHRTCGRRLPRNQLGIVTFSSPKVGNYDFRRFVYDNLGVNNVVNFACETDPVPVMPPATHGYTEAGLTVPVLFSQIMYGKSVASVEEYRLKVERGELSRSSESSYVQRFSSYVQWFSSGIKSITSPMAFATSVALKSIPYFAASSHSIPPTEAIICALEEYRRDMRLGVPFAERGRSSGIISNRNPYIKMLM